MSLLTVGLPIYNSMPYLRESVESLLAQTVSDFEILAVVDDCTDGSVEYIESVKDSRLRILRQPKSGLIPTLNRMLKEVETPWLVRQDTDDISYPSRIRTLIEGIKDNPHAGMFCSLAEYYPPKQSIGMFRCTRGTPENFRNIVGEGYLLSFCHSSVALNVEKTLSLGGYRNLKHAEDADLWWRMALQYDIHLLNEALVGYRHHSTQSTTHGTEQQTAYALFIQYLLLSHLWSLPAQPWDCVKEVLGGLVSKKDARSKELIREVNINLSNHQYIKAVESFARSFAASPSYLIGRIRDEFLPGVSIVNGVSPKLFLERKHELWPDPVVLMENPSL